MTLNKDIELGRFLYAILKQLDTRSINWDLVAQDDVLMNPIRSGHAARMRYHRYRKTIDGNPSTGRRPLLDESNTQPGSGSRTRASSSSIKTSSSFSSSSSSRPKRTSLRPKREDTLDPIIKHESTPDIPSLASPSPYHAADETFEDQDRDQDQDQDLRLLTPCSGVDTLMHPIAAQDMPLFGSGGCDPANLCLSGGAALESSQGSAMVSQFEDVIFLGYSESDVIASSGWDERFDEAHEY